MIHGDDAYLITVGTGLIHGLLVDCAGAGVQGCFWAPRSPHSQCPHRNPALARALSALFGHVAALAQPACAITHHAPSSSPFLRRLTRFTGKDLGSVSCRRTYIHVCLNVICIAYVNWRQDKDATVCSFARLLYIHRPAPSQNACSTLVVIIDTRTSQLELFVPP